ncbi:MAG TPA: alpha/beta fold hydrolase [Bryobacteraceae bacterium]|nr:alpha/beta fold hydrolase [Bryobacteraceae bacterium]
MKPFLLATAVVALCSTASAGDEAHILRLDHYVQVRSTVPAISGQSTEIYVREVVEAGTVLRGGPAADRVALFIHGAGTPAEVAFDVPYHDYSWMAYLAQAGFDVFSMDMTGYGRSTRPTAMSDPCNLSREQQNAFVPALIPAPCSASYPQQMTTLASDWYDIDAVVDHIRALRHVEKLDLLAWSLGGPRSAGYAAGHPDKVSRLVLLAPAYNRAASATPPPQVPADGAAMNTQSRDEFIRNWNRQVGCTDQYEPAARDSVWSEMLLSDPVGATWGTGVRRAPQVTVWGWTTAIVSKMQIPTLMVSGAHDKQVNPERVRELYADLGSTQKVFVDLACSSHNAMWEKNHLLLFQASLEWLTKGTVEGKQEGMLRLGY